MFTTVCKNLRKLAGCGTSVAVFKTQVSSAQVTLGNDAQFWACISPPNDTAK